MSATPGAFIPTLSAILEDLEHDYRIAENAKSTRKETLPKLFSLTPRPSFKWRFITINGKALGWLPNGRPWPCSRCDDDTRLTRRHAIWCLRMHVRLRAPLVVCDPMSFTLNRIPRKPPRNTRERRFWRAVWPELITILHELDTISHDTTHQLRESQPPPPLSISVDFLRWIG